MKRLDSMQARLLALLLLLLSVVWLGAAVLMWKDARHELDELLDGHLAQAASLLVVQQASAGDEDDEGEVADAPLLHKYAPRVAFQVFHEGQLRTRSINADSRPMSNTTEGFSTVTGSDGTAWRVFAARGMERDVQVFVGEQTQSRRAILWAVLHSMLWPLALALPLLALAGWWAVRQGLAPLRLLSHDLTHRLPDALEPLPPDQLPQEMRPLVLALNGLFERMTRMVAFERRFTADAAHELRTPIAAIRAQAQVALGAGDDSAQRQHALQTTLAGCDRATRLVEQLLTLARLETPASPEANSGTSAMSATRADLGTITRQVAAELAPAALARHQTLSLEADAPCGLAGDALLLSVLVRNLIDNALRYSPNGAAVQVRVTRTLEQAVLQVDDSGPGMREQEMARLGERFYRAQGQEQPGSGLGWSIVKRVAQVSGAQVQVARSPTLGGLAITVRWPSPPALAH